MKIKDLFEAYRECMPDDENTQRIFRESGMVNRREEMDYAFFPLGSGVLTDTDQSKIDVAEIGPGGIMVLGNDFGTVRYVDEMKDKRENSSRTIYHLKSLKMDMDKTFFTNYYMGLRDDAQHPGTTMTKRVVPFKEEYDKLCLDFFRVQMDKIKPRMVICLGTYVRQAIAKYSPELGHLGKGPGIMKRYASGNCTAYTAYLPDGSNGRGVKFIIVPHPSFAHIYWERNGVKEKIQAEMNQ